ncbi:PSD1 and planctomycete cytochrome C domain-containing protein [Aporhodopirellula aestuarii]|uniref:PSD1 and planctomycete cytochrome C domain-containing protein n=1 Tax=Aporhodopirellula aestuarii TaxID=2950107 RepID=A0ABT0U9G4_9BACT|nr:PSD1 and planctomycete cytochrome C domain-containing protein [Aporhodopirellula aestuarii]MCM2373416.1 PSD1 and planctomycete cytochrome C domain-containing protein [Aporhodopirellula aestuarii]
MQHRLSCYLSVLLGLFSTAVSNGEKISFNEQVRPILSRHCIACHGPDEDDRQAGLRLDTFEGATEDFGGYAAVVPGDPDASEILVRILTDDDDIRMPPSDHAERLSKTDAETLRTWIKQGADYETHWSFRVPQIADVPSEIRTADHRVVDYWIDQKLTSVGLSRNDRAKPHALVRRLSLDLTGLPPVAHPQPIQSAIQQYLTVPTADRFADLADQLMQTPAFAEHWAAMWLDLARYADTVGYSGDEHRDMWPWRDWLIASILENKSYREMSIEMIAGDLLPDATIDQKLATAFHRNTLSNNEGGTNDEEFRTVAIKDRLSTTLNTWMGITIRCAECHSHKYDPISHAEYYQLLDYFNQSLDADRRDEHPKLPVPPRRDLELAKTLERKLPALRDAVASQPIIWTSRQPSELKGQSGSTLERLDDNSILATGNNPSYETYEATFELPPGQSVRAIRLEAIPHLKHDGKVGRSGDGGFILSQIWLTKHQNGVDGKVSFKDAEADFHQPNHHPRTAIKESVESGLRNQGWAVRHPVTGYTGHHEAVFELAEPLDGAVATSFTVSLRHDSPWVQLNMGCFRISTTDVENAAERYRNGDLDADRIELRKWETIAAERVRVPVMEEMPIDKKRETFVMLGGNYLSHGEKVAAKLPDAFVSQSDDFENNRLGLAKWIFDASNPLTARVAVNRYWARLIGVGLVETEEDFGTQGTPPSHPQLLDFLAVQFQKEGWDVRRLLKTIVMSESYQQSQIANADALEIDPRNRFLSRGPRIRLQAEVVRDQALSVAGLMSDKLFGPPVYPPSPIKRVVNAFTGGMTWQESTGEDRYRRAIYTYLKRSAPHPLFETFDMSSRDVCSLRRLRTNTPLQSFMTLNDVTFIEAARGLANLMLAQTSQSESVKKSDSISNSKLNDLDEMVRFGLCRALFIDEAPEEQVDVLAELYLQCQQRYQGNLSDAAEFVGQSVDVKTLNEEQNEDLIRQASMTVVANVILNLDAVLNN